MAAIDHTANTSINSIIADNSIECPRCGKRCKGQRGLTIHTGKAHPTQRREEIVANIGRQEEESPEMPEFVRPELSPNSDLMIKIEEFNTQFSQLLMIYNEDEFNLKLANFVQFLSNEDGNLPIPKDPRRKFMVMRKNKNTFRNIKTGYGKSSNPERSSKKEREERKNKYNHEFTQYLYYTQRRKCFQRVMGRNGKQCQVPINDLY